jgi:hypothetical protein
MTEMPPRPPPVQQLLFRAEAARRASANEPLSDLVDALVGRLSRALDALGHHMEGGAYTHVFMALATAVDVAEALAPKPEA